MSTARLDDAFRAAIDDQIIPGAVLVATNKSGTLNYEKAFGKAGVSPTAGLLSLESTFWIASCTKLLASICVLQCVDEGLFTLDSPEDVARFLPEMSAPDIIVGTDENDQVIVKPASKKLTARHLVTHTSGLGYPFLAPALVTWIANRGIATDASGTMPIGDLVDAFRFPLLFEPGEKWEYGVGLDWAGKMVERASGMTLENYMQEHICGPLGMKNTTFHLEKNEDVRRHLAETALRDPDTGVWTQVECPQRDPIGDEQGGGGVYSSATDYIKVLASILKDDGKLLKTESVEEMFRPQLSGTARMPAGFGPGREKEVPDHGIGGKLTTEDDGEIGSKKRTLSWGGYPNLNWWIDREAGICGLYASQVLPGADLKSTEMYTIFQKEIYKTLRDL